MHTTNFGPTPGVPWGPLTSRSNTGYTGYGAAGVWNDIYSKPGEPVDYETGYQMPERYYWWYDGANLATGDQMTYFKNFYSSLQWWKLIPRFNDSAWGSFIDASRSLLSSDGNNTYVVFFFNSGTSTGSLKQMDSNYLYKLDDGLSKHGPNVCTSFGSMGTATPTSLNG